MRLDWENEIEVIKQGAAVSIYLLPNMFAVMGLRQMFFVLEHMHERFQYVKYGVAVILIFTGVKMLLDIFDIHIHNLISIAVILFVLIASIIISVIVSKGKDDEDEADRMEKKKEIEEAFRDSEVD